MALAIGGDPSRLSSAGRRHGGGITQFYLGLHGSEIGRVNGMKRASIWRVGTVEKMDNLGLPNFLYLKFYLI